MTQVNISKDEDLLSVLIPEQLQTLSREECEAYIGQLTSYSVDRLAKEPALLEAESIKIKGQMENLAFENYKSFIETADCVQEVNEKIVVINNNVSQVVSELPSLVQTCEEFCVKAAEDVRIRELNRKALLKHSQILELLEIPDLMNNCVKNGFFEEALELHLFVKKMNQNYPNVVLIDHISQQVSQTSHWLVRKLYEQLQCSVQLPMCLRVVSYLKRLDIYSDIELRKSFLESRDVWLRSELSSISQVESGYSFLSRLADSSRLHLFEIVTQYRAIFTEKTPNASDNTSFFDEKMDNSNELASSLLLHGWLLQHIAGFIGTLTTHLPRVNDGASLANLLDQCMYFALAMGRIGADFRSLLSHAFEQRLVSMISRLIATATERFLARLERKTAIPAPVVVDLLESSDSARVPKAIARHPWLALLGNGWIAALNELRQCAIFSVANRLAEVFSENALIICTALRTVATLRHFEGPEEEAFKDLCRSVGELLLPFVVTSFDSIYRSKRQLVNLGAARKQLLGLYAVVPVATKTNETGR